jgi:hypothetical protein
MPSILPPSAEAAARQLGNTAADHFEATAKQQFTDRIDQFIEAGGFTTMFGQILLDKLAPVQAELDRACQSFNCLPKDTRGQGFGKRSLGSATIEVKAE